MAQQLTARSIGLPAAAVLQPGTEGRVLATFRRACDLITDDGQVIALVSSEIGDGPLNVVLDVAPWEQPQWPSRDIRFRVQEFSPLTAARSTSLSGPGFCIHFSTCASPACCGIRPDTRLPGRHNPDGYALPSQGPLSCIGLWAALPWDPRLDWPALAEGLSQAPCQGEEHQLSNVADAVVCALAECAAGSAEGSGLPSSSRQAWREATRRVVRAQRSENLDALSHALCDLCGLGPGLTPAGDDWLAGWLMALRARGDLAVAAYCGEVVRSTAATRTTALSGALLACAARGEADVRWHALVAALSARPTDMHAIRRAGQAIVAQGASSGHAMLAGFLAGIGRPQAARRRGAG